MLRAITLRNYKIFGAAQTIPLSPITVLVGPNNVGKSCVMSLGEFVKRAMEDAVRPQSTDAALSRALHRSTEGDAQMEIGWEGDDVHYQTALAMHEDALQRRSEHLIVEGTTMVADDPVPPPLRGGAVPDVVASQRMQRPFAGAAGAAQDPGRRHAVDAAFQPLLASRLVKLSIDRLREDSKTTAAPALGMDGEGIGAVLSLWRGFDPDRSEQLDAFLQECLPEAKRALVRPADAADRLRIWIEQTDGQKFAPDELSDGVLFFVALAMHAIDAPPGAVIFAEEPEQSIHPLRVRQIVDLFRRAVAARGCQFVLATHSPTLLDEFRDEPEAIVLLQRSPEGTRVSTLDRQPRLMEALQSAHATPGELLINGLL